MTSTDRTYNEIVNICKKAGARRVILFGSRARKSNLPKSDIDIAVEGCGASFDELYDTLQNSVWSLLSIDVINLDDNISAELKREIERDGVTLYEKV